jgi:hypothetical protein
MHEALHRRAKAVRSRAAIRRWEYRQRHHANGVWFRLRRAMAEADYALEVDADELAHLAVLPEVRSMAVGAELEPAKSILLITKAEAATVRGARLPLRLDARFLAARNIVLVQF